MAALDTYVGTGDITLVNALLAANSGITIVTGTISLNESGQTAVNYYDGSLAGLGIGPGLLLSSGTTPGTSNTAGWFGNDNSAPVFDNGDADINAVVNTVFQTQSYDATTLAFDFTAGATATSVSFDLVFGSDEYPEWVDQFVDCAVVMVNGVNYAYFNHDPLAPLSVVSSNLAAGYFQDNAGNVLPIEYDGVSHVLKIVAPINVGQVNHIKIGIADTGDHIYDSGIFLSDFSAGTIPGSGVVSTPITGTAGPDTVTGTAKAEYFDLKGGDDTVYAGAGDDIVVAGAGNDAVYGGSGADQLKGDAGDDDLDGGTEIDTAVYAGNRADFNIVFSSTSGTYTFTHNGSGTAPEGTDTLTGVEFAQFNDGLWSLGVTGTVALVSAPGPVPPPGNQAGTVFISGVGGQGQTLTATVSDPNGVPANGVTYAWQADGVDLAVNARTFVVGAAQVGQAITVTASYTDLANHAEFVTSSAKTIAAPGNGDFAITLLILDAPVGASVMNPLTTLVKNAIDLGVSPNEAGIIVKSVLGIAATVDLQHYDSWAVLQAHPGNPAALAVEKKAVQVAVMTSLGSDETGMALTQAILLSHSNNTPLHLTDTAVIANLLGLDPANRLVHEIWDRNDNIAAAATVAEIEANWADMQSGLSVVLSDSIGTLSVHINQSPTGTATASLPIGLQDSDYTINASDLLAGFSDSDGGTLSISGLSASNGSVTIHGGGSSFTITPTVHYSGPVELTYTVLDGQGGSAPASQLYGIAATAVAVNTAPTGSATAILAAGTEDIAYTVSAADLVAGFSDADTADVLSISSLGASTGTAVQNPDGSWTITPAANFNGPVTLSYSVTDGTSSIAATQSFTLAAVNDAPTGSVTITGMATQGQTLSASNTLADADGLGTIGYLWQANGLTISGATGGSLELTVAEVGKAISLVAHYTDGFGTVETVSSGFSSTVASFSAVTGTAGHDILNGFAGADSILGLGGDDTINGLGGMDTIDGGAGTDIVVIDAATAGVLGYSLHDSVLSITTASGTQILSHVERVQLTDALFAFDTHAPSANDTGGHVWQAAALLHAAFGAMPDLAALSHWTAEADHAASMAALGQKMIDTYAPGISPTDFVDYLYRSVVHAAPTADVLQGLVSQVGAGRAFATQGDLFAYAASLTLNTDGMVGFAGSIQPLDASFFG